MSRNRYRAEDVRRVLEAVSAESPNRVDRRCIDDLAPRYIEHGKPNCLVAVLLSRLGISLGLLKQLDNELRGPGGVLLWTSRHAIRRRFTPAAWELLSALQFCNDTGNTWKAASEKVFTPDVWIGRRWKPVHKWNNGSIGRPWIDELNNKETRS